jgi:hypothetical protein
VKAIRQRSLYDSKRWHLATDDGGALCGTKLTGRLQESTREAAGRGYGAGLCQRCITKADGTGGSIKLTAREMDALITRATEAATKAYAETIPTPMIVGTPKNMMASLMGGDDGGFDESQPVYQVDGGICGSAYVLIQPANSRMANHLRKRGMGSNDSYHRCLRIGADRFIADGEARWSQSVTRTSAAANAAAAILREAGIKAYADEWIN